MYITYVQNPLISKVNSVVRRSVSMYTVSNRLPLSEEEHLMATGIYWCLVLTECLNLVVSSKLIC